MVVQSLKLSCPRPLELLSMTPGPSVHLKIKMAAINSKTRYSCILTISRKNRALWTVYTLSPPLGLHWYARLLPNGHPCARVTYDLPSGDQNSNKEPEWVPKTFDSQAKFQWTNNKIPCSFCTLKHQWKTFDHQPYAKKYFWRYKVNAQHYFCDFSWRAVEVSGLKMVLKEFNSLWKNFDNKIMTFPSVLKRLGHYCMK